MMKKNQSRILSAGILLLGALWILASAGVNSSAPVGAPGSGPEVGLTAPDFTLELMSGGQVSLSSLRGNAVVINFWASWCGPCRAEMPAIENIYNEYKQQGLVVLAVNATIQDSLIEAQAFVTQYGLTFPILLDSDGTVSNAYRLSGLPTTYFIGRDGVIKKINIGGPLTEAQLRIEIENLLNGAP